MTALCGGGPSGPQSGVGGVLTLGATAIEIFVATVLALPELAPVVAPIIAGLVDIEIAAYCGTDPPADPTLTGSDIIDALKFPPDGSTFPAQQKILTWFESQYWYQVCQCTGTTTPAALTPSNPGQVSSNPGLPGPASPICWTQTVNYVVNPSDYYDMSPTGLPPGKVTLRTVATGPPIFQVATVPLGVGTNLTMTTTLDQDVSSSTTDVFIKWVPWNAGGPVTPDGLEALWNQPGLASSSVLSQARMCTTQSCLGVTPITGWALWVENTDTIQHSGSVTISWNCTTPFSSQPCCSPDPILEGELQQILQYVQAIYAGLPIPLNSFAEGTTHAALTGNGSVTLDITTIGVKIDLTTIPSWVGFEVSSPDFYFDVGFVAFSTSEGTYSPTRVVYQEQIVNVPPLSGSLAYSFENGVVATVTELSPGP